MRAPAIPSPRRAPGGLDELTVAVLHVAADGCATSSNAAWRELTGLTAEQSQGLGWLQAVPVEDRERLLGRLACDGDAALDCALAGAGRERHTRWSWRARTWGCADRAVTVVDLTADRDREAQLRHRACHDALTEATNRQRFLELVQQALSRASETTRIGVVYADLDNFKGINDSGGHALGDLVLQEVSVRLRGRLRACDVLGRVGGDEFAVLCVGPDEEVLSVADRVAAALADPIALADRQVQVTATVGVALAAGAHETPEALMARADQAMYAGKAQRVRSGHEVRHDRRVGDRRDP